MSDVRGLKAEVFQAMGHSTRLAILELLQRGELTVSAILDRLGMEQGTVSQHLGILRSRRLVASRRAGNRVYYSLRDPVLTEVLGLMRRYAARRLAEDLARLRAMDAVPAQARRFRRPPAVAHGSRVGSSPSRRGRR